MNSRALLVLLFCVGLSAQGLAQSGPADEPTPEPTPQAPVDVPVVQSAEQVLEGVDQDAPEKPIEAEGQAPEQVGSEIAGTEPKSTSEPSIQPADDLPARKLTRSDYQEYAYGSVKACESILFPLTFIPGAGSAIGSIVDWGCLIPSAFTISHLSKNYSEAGETFGPAFTALLAAKIFRSLIFYPIIAGIGVGSVLYATGAGAFFIFRDEREYAAIGFAGFLTLAGTAFLVGRVIETRGADCIFGCVYFGLTKADKKALDKGAQAEARKRNGPITGLAKGYNLFSIAAGSRPDGSLQTLIPVAGPLLRIKPKIENYREAFRTAAVYDYADGDRDLDKLDGTIKTVVYTEGILMSAAQGFLVAGGIAFVSGTALYTVGYDDDDRVNRDTALAAGLGVTGVALAGTGLALLGVRELTQLAKPWFFSIQYKRSGNSLAANAE